MRGKGWGGQRPGAGRKPKSSLERLVTGDPGHRGRVLSHPSAGQVPVVAPVTTFDPPADLTADERKVWDDLAPHAFSARTLTRGTMCSFLLLCRNIVLERALAGSAERGGSNHRGLIQRVDAELLRFSLSPCGKAIYEAEPAQVPDSKLGRFMKKRA